MALCAGHQKSGYCLSNQGKNAARARGDYEAAFRSG